MMKRIAALLLTLVLALSAMSVAQAKITPYPNDKGMSSNGSYVLGSSGDGVKEIQTLLKSLGYYSGSITGKYKGATRTAVIWFQRSNGLTVDGKVGEKTLNKMKSSTAVKATDAVAKNTTANGGLTIGSTGAEVLDVQKDLQKLNYYKGPLDGLFSEETAQAVKAFQKNNNLTPDGIVGPYTLLKLKTGIPWTEEFNHEVLDFEYPLTSAAAKGQTQNGSYFKGAEGADIKNYQTQLAALGYYEGPINGKFDQATEDAVREFQRRNGLKEDGMIGKSTAAAMADPSAIKKTDMVPTVFTLASGSSSPFIKSLQIILKTHYFYNGKYDGVYGPDMVAAVKLVQAAAGLTVDGKAGPKTQEVIMNLPSSLGTYPIRTLKLGSRGYDVYMLQQRLINGNYLKGIYTKGEFDAATEKAVKKAQKTFMIKEDGIFGSNLRRYLWATHVAATDNENSKYEDWDDNGNFVGKTLKKGSSGEQVRYIQMKLKSNGFLLDDADGIYGDSTKAAVLKLQRMINKQKVANGNDNFLKEDGIVGPQTWTILRDLHLTSYIPDYMHDELALDQTIDNPTEGDELVEVDADKPAISAITRKLKLGSNGKQVKLLQQMMIKAGYLSAGDDDGYYGPNTKAAVLAFQQDMNAGRYSGKKVIKEDGIVGTETLYHLQLELSGQELDNKVQP